MTEAIGYYQSIGNFIYYSIQVVYMLAVIAYVGYTFGWVKQPKVKGDVTGQVNDTWSNAGNFLANAADVAKKVNKVFEKAEEVKKPE